jgi:flagellar hook-associated protein 1
VSLEIALQNAISGLQTSKQSLQVISNNIANVNTEGYSRKIVEQAARVIEGTGYGVEISRIKRNIDDGVLRQLRTESGTLNRLTLKEDFLKQVNTLFGRPEDNVSMVHQIAELGAQFDSLAVSPETEATQFLTVKAASDLVNNMKRLSDELQRLRADANIKLADAVDEFNSLLDSVVDLNLDIIEFTASGISTAELEDQRDQAINRMSELMDVKYFEKGDGSLTVFSGSGHTLVSGQAQHLTYNRPSTMVPTLEYTPTDATNYISPGQTGYPVGGIPGIFVGELTASQDVTSVIGNGELKALVDLRDTDMPSLQGQIDELAEKLKDEINRVHNQGAGFPPVVAMTGDRYVSGGTSLVNATGMVRIAAVDLSGNLIEDAIFDLSGVTDVTDLIGDINGSAAIPNVTASINSEGRFVLSAQNGYRIVVNELTSNLSAAGDLDEGFSDFFGLNNFMDSSETFARYRSDALGSSSSAAVITGGTLQFSGDDGTAFTATVNYAANDSITTIAAAINANVTLQGENISAEVIADGDNFRLQISDADGDEFAVVETGVGSALDDLGLRTDYRGISNRLTVRSDIVDNTFFISRGALQSNTFESGLTGVTSTTAAIGAANAGNLVFTLLDGSTTTIAYDGTTDSLTDIANDINSDATLTAANITAQVVAYDNAGTTNYRLKVVDGNGDNYWIADSDTLALETTQGVAVGDGSVAAAIAEAFNSQITFLSAPARGGGLAQTDASFSDYAASILSFSSAQTSSVQRDLGFQEGLRNELYNKNTSVSGVNMDEELSNLIIYEEAYLAAARMVTTTQQLFDALIEMVGAI